MTITPVLRYRDASAAAGWLCKAFGFHEHDRSQELDGYVRYVSLRLGDSFVLVRSVGSSVFDELMVQPDAIGGANTQVCHLTVADTDQHRERAEAAGARIELEPRDDGLGGRFYTCRDQEDHLWIFGTRTYGASRAASGAFEPVELVQSAPRAATAVARHGGDGREPATRGAFLRSVGMFAVAAAALAAGGWVFYGAYTGTSPKRIAAVQAAPTAEQLIQERSRRVAAEDASREAAKRLEEERAAAADTRHKMQVTQAELAQARRERSAAVQALSAVKDRVEANLAAAREKVAEEGARWAAAAKSADEEKAAIQERLAKLRQDGVMEKAQLQEAQAALLAARKEIEHLRGARQEPGRDGSKGVAADVEVAAQPSSVPEPNATCALAVQGRIPSGHKATSVWADTNLARLCQGAETSVEPATCFEELMRGKVNWGASSVWTTPNALTLCEGTRNARRTLDCFAKRIASDDTWQVAIRQCKTN